MARRIDACEQRQAGKLNDGQQRLAIWLAQAADGDADAFARLYAATAVKMRQTVEALVADPAEVDDILQTGYLKVWRGAHLYRTSLSSPITWMTWVMRHSAIDRLRQSRYFCELGEEALAVAADMADPCDTLDRARHAKMALAALKGLPRKRAKLLAEAYIDGLSRKALAQRYKVPPSTIKTWIRRSIASVRVQMADAATSH